MTSRHDNYEPATRSDDPIVWSPAASCKLTRRSKEALLRLLELAEKYPANPYGFTGKSVRPSNAAACRNYLEPFGLVFIDHVNTRGFRYRLTSDGMARAKAIKAEHEPRAME